MARPKGVPNKISGQIKKNIAAVFDRIGGLDAMAKWASENQTEFYRIYVKLLPTDLNVKTESGSIEEYVEQLDDDEFKRFADGIKRIVISARDSEAAEARGTIN